MENTIDTRQPMERSAAWGLGAAAVVLGATLMVLMYGSLERNGVQRTLIFTAVVLSAVAALGAVLGLIHLAWIATRRDDRRQVRWHISLALVSGLIIGLAVWVPQQLLEGKLDDILKAAEAESEQARVSNAETRAANAEVQESLDAVLVENQLTQIETQPVQRNADLVNADLEGARLGEIDFTGSNLSHAELGSALLTGTVLTDARLVRADLGGANLEHATLIDADLRRATLDDAVLTGADLAGADLSNASLIDASLRDAVLSGADLEATDLSGADLEGASVSAEALGAASLDRTTVCPGGDFAEAGDDGTFGCVLSTSLFMLRSDLVDPEAEGETIASEFTCDATDPGPPAIGWREAPDGGEAVIAMTRGDEILWLVAVPRESVRVVAPFDGSETVLRDYTPPCPPLADGVDTTTQSFVLTMYVMPMPLPRDPEGTVLGTARDVLDAAAADATAQASITAGYMRTQG